MLSTRTQNSNGTLTINHQVPYEILQEIFLHCVPLTDGLAVNSRLSSSSLCFPVENVTQSTPRLWNRLIGWCDGSTLDFDRATATLTNRDGPLVQMRPGNTFRYRYTVRPHPEAANPCPYHRPQSSPPIPSVHQRTRNRATRSFPARKLRYLQKDPLELLEAVWISMRCRDELNVTTEHFSFPPHPDFAVSRSTFRGRGPLEPQFTQMPWTQLTCLVLKRDVPLEAWRTIVRLCLTLQRCYLEIELPGRATLAHLEDFTLVVYIWEALVGALRVLHFPALKSLHLACREGEDFGLTSKTPFAFSERMADVVHATTGVVWASSVQDKRDYEHLSLPSTSPATCRQ
ncbi:hypothetical protein Hypma_003610 [Hypsizygus marmoreus]|uniref:Uncharacterized protein n=1 Tax=Hypsizygus marmoreus TaxID=39966 RepID=A0A369J1M1_HYPMA|nr:hypothetical protein Hypma_003610 [Hypsizygus marmoreus]